MLLAPSAMADMELLQLALARLVPSMAARPAQTSQPALSAKLDILKLVFSATLVLPVALAEDTRFPNMQTVIVLLFVVMESSSSLTRAAMIVTLKTEMAVRVPAKSNPFLRVQASLVFATTLPL